MAPLDGCTLYDYVATVAMFSYQIAERINHLYYKSNTYDRDAAFDSRSSSSV
jgi:hypothetical protein